MKKESRFIPITSKVNTIIIFALVIGIGSISFIFATRLFSTIDESIKQNLAQQSEILYSAIQNFMMPGYAEIAVNYFDDIKAAGRGYEVNLFRRSGVPAFSDDATLEEVRAKSPGLNERFSDPVDRLAGDVGIVTEYFDVATAAPPASVFFKTTQPNGTRSFRAYKPLINLPKCTSCHGADHTVRGVIDIRQDVTRQRADQRLAIIIAGSLFVGIVVSLAILLSAFMRRTVIKPVKKVGEVCSNVTNGDFESRVSIKNRDEIGTLGKTVNTMVEGLHERFELTKFVSSSTMKSLRENKAGHRVPVTVLFSDIRGFTAYSEKQSAENVVKYLNQALNVQTEIIHKWSGDVDKYVGDEIVAMFSDENQVLNACRAAIEIQSEFSAHSGDKYDNLKVGIGINEGEVILGMIGSERRADFTFIGDNVNIASRLCSAAKPLQILISESCFEKIKQQIKVDGPYRMQVKGKVEYLRVHVLQSIIENENK